MIELGRKEDAIKSLDFPLPTALSFLSLYATINLDIVYSYNFSFVFTSIVFTLLFDI